MAKFTPQPNCVDLPDKALSVALARQRITDLVSPVTTSEKRSLNDSLGYILHQAIKAPINVPPHNNAAMDGYAVHGSMLSKTPVSLEQVGIALAGSPYSGNVATHQCVRIMTGAVMPNDCDTVVMQEHVDASGDVITVHGRHKPKQHVRYAGEDLTIDSTILSEGHKIMPADLGLVASLGISKLIVKRPVRVAFFATGDELQSIGKPLKDGQIYDSNRYTLYSMLKQTNAKIIDLGVVPDQKQTLTEVLCAAGEQADIVITTGGVSVGDADYVKQALADLGQVNFWRIAMKPGRPLAVGKINDAMFFGLPGNPVSVMVTFYQFVVPALEKISGQTKTATYTLTANCVSAIRKRPGRFEFQRGVLANNDQGELQVSTTGEQGSGILRSMSVANCFILLDEACSDIKPNTAVTVQPFSALI